MASQTLIFVPLPNGIVNGKLAMSVYLSPRLTGGATLAAFPDILDWPQLIQQHGLTFELTSGTQTAQVAANPAVLRPDIWNSIFAPTTFVEAPSIPDYDQRIIISYPVRKALTFFKYAYQVIGTGSAGSSENRRNPLQLVLGDLVFRNDTGSTLASEISRLRIELWQQQQQLLHPPPAPPIVPAQAITAVAPPVPPDGVPTTLSAPVDVHDTMTRFYAFHSMPPAPNGPPPPSTEADFAKVLDFHRALTALNSYPALMRALGLVFDIELPLSLCAPSPTGVYGTITVSKVTPSFTPSIAPAYSFPAVSYVRDSTTFQTAPATLPNTSTWAPGDVVGGFLALTPDNFHLLQVDVDGGLLKTLTVADNLANARDATIVGDDLPSIRSGGIGLIADGRGLQLLESIVDNKSFDASLTGNQPFSRPFNARDITRGFRIDVWSSRKNKWLSLHRRNAAYAFGPGNSITINSADEEGFLQPTAAQPADDPTRKPDPTSTGAGIPQPGTDLYVHERLARWDGWSLSASRPGLALNRSPDPAEATTPDPTLGQPLTPFKMTSSFAATPGSLPELRFGASYRIRARAVDLAGNSLPPSSTVPDSLVVPADAAPLPYLRFEPVNPPLLVLQQPTQMGSSQARMVIRSENSSLALDAVPTTESDHRHIAPPRIAERLAEHHGLFDDLSGRLKADAATFNLIAQRDTFEFPTSGSGTDAQPIDPSPLVNVGYLPDVLARGAALRDLPNTLDDTDGRIVSDALTYTPLPDVQTRAGSVTFIDFGTAWPERIPFLISLIEGTAPPQWDNANRVLQVCLPKGTSVDIDLSCYLNESDLGFMGVWAWLREYVAASELNAMQSGAAYTVVGNVTDTVALLTRLILEGGHPMLTPARTLTLVHATQQPVGRPQFVQLPVVHRPSSPIYASALRNSFTPITAWRSVNSHAVTLVGALEIRGASTSKVDILARWLEYVDDPSTPAPTKTWQGNHVETLSLPTTASGQLYSDATETRMVATYIPSVDALWFSLPLDELEGVYTPSEISAPVHRLDDSKHRWIGYTAVATTRFQEYFPEGLDYTRSSEPLLVDVPSSARPLAPDIAYVVPTFGWERQESSNLKSSVRFGNGLRVYLHRPWYSSGDSELLGVILWNGVAPDYATRETYKPLFTQWGNDPIWKTGFLESVPSVYDFPNAFATAQSLTLEETPRVFDVAGHQVQFDQQRGLWYCDIEFSNSSSYMPFVRLALARYQSHSIQGVELSRVILADFAQLTPDRSCIISIDPSDTRSAQIFIGGVAPQAPLASVIEVTVEQRHGNLVSDLAWEIAIASVVQVTESSPDATEQDAVLWSGTILFAKRPPPGQFRVVVREYERIEIDGMAIVIGPRERIGERLVYVAVVNYDYPPQT
jgi:hypothetical protein